MPGHAVVSASGRLSTVPVMVMFMSVLGSTRHSGVTAVAIGISSLSQPGRLIPKPREGKLSLSV